MSERLSQRGFTLLEVLVAFSIAAAALALLMQVFGAGLRLSKTALDYARATSLAESLLAEGGTGYVLNGMARSGTFDETFDWTIEIAPYPVDADLPIERGTVSLVRLFVRVSWSEGLRPRRLEIASLRLQPRPE